MEEKILTDEFVNRELQWWNVPGVTLGICQGGKTIQTDGFGYRDIGKKLPMTGDTLGGIASCSKSFCSAVIASLVDEGVLDYDRPVHEYLPELEFYDPTATRECTLRDMLCHRTGIVGHDAMWPDAAITRKEYLGHTVNFKTRKHFKDKKSHYVAQKYWQIFEDTQEPIIDEETFENAQKCRTGIKRYPNGWGEPHPLDGKMVCHDCGGLMYCHRTSNGKKVAQYVCAKYGKQPVGTYCNSGHRINADAVMEIVRDTLKYLKTTIDENPEEFIEHITQTEADNRNAEAKKKQDRLKVCRKRVDELERLICKIYEDNALGKMPESRYETLVRQYSNEQNNLNEEIEGIEDFLSEVEENRKSGKRFVNLMSRYNDFEEITPFMVSEFIDRIEVHERDRKGSVQTTQKIDIYFNFIGNYSMPEKELTEAEKAEIERINGIKDKRHQAYLKRKESGKQKVYEKKYDPVRRARITKLKEQNKSTYAIPAEEYDQEHYSKASVVLAESAVPDF